uniref:Uncharacterized protein n=1 Tax=Meloidogyne javanica TaxID=6303 RepID=A0A915N1I5_MELJA
MEKFSSQEHRNKCQHLWEISKNFGDLEIFTVCVRHFIEKQMVNRTFDEGKVRVLPKAAGWVRDGGHTETKFSTKDFINFGDLEIFTVCVRHFMEKQMVNRTFDEGKVRVFPKAAGWARDAGHTETKFSTKDFMFHGWKAS